MKLKHSFPSVHRGQCNTEDANRKQELNSWWLINNVAERYPETMEHQSGCDSVEMFWDDITPWTFSRCFISEHVEDGRRTGRESLPLRRRCHNNTFTDELTSSGHEGSVGNFTVIPAILETSHFLKIDHREVTEVWTSRCLSGVNLFCSSKCNHRWLISICGWHHHQRKKSS